MPEETVRAADRSVSATAYYREFVQLKSLYGFNRSGDTAELTLGAARSEISARREFVFGN